VYSSTSPTISSEELLIQAVQDWFTTRADNRRPDSLPAAAQGVIELDCADEFGIADLLEREFGR
jgi:hypothetical protein